MISSAPGARTGIRPTRLWASGFAMASDVARAHMRIKLKARDSGPPDKLAEGACRRSTAVHLNHCGRWSRVLSSPQSKHEETDDRDVGSKH